MTHQPNMFAETNADLPLFSSTAQIARREEFNPPQASRQLDLLPRPEPWVDEPEPQPIFCYICGELADLDKTPTTPSVRNATP